MATIQKLRRNVSTGLAEQAAGGGVVATKASGRQIFNLRGAPDTYLGANSTFAVCASIPGGFTAVRLCFYNDSTAAPRSFKAKVCASAIANQNGAGLTGISVTKNGSTTITVPAATTVEGQTVPAVVVSDYIGVSSIPRTDTPGADPCLYLRITSPEGVAYSSRNFTLANYIAQGWQVFTSYNGSSNLVDTWSNMATNGQSLSAVPWVGVEVTSAAKKASIVLFADSLAAGLDQSISYFDKLVAKLRTSNYPMHVGQMAVGGRRRSVFSGICQSFVAATKPDIVVIHDYTVNSSGTLTAEQQMGLLVSDVRAIVEAGGTPIIVLMHTNVTYAARVRQAYSGVYPIVDMGLLLSNGDGVILDQYCHNPVTDRTHISDLACGVVSDAVYAEIAALLPPNT